MKKFLVTLFVLGSLGSFVGCSSNLVDGESSKDNPSENSSWNGYTDVRVNFVQMYDFAGSDRVQVELFIPGHHDSHGFTGYQAPESFVFDRQLQPGDSYQVIVNQEFTDNTCAVDDAEGVVESGQEFVDVDVRCGADVNVNP